MMDKSIAKALRTAPAISEELQGNHRCVIRTVWLKSILCPRKTLTSVAHSS